MPATYRENIRETGAKFRGEGGERLAVDLVLRPAMLPEMRRASALVLVLSAAALSGCAVIGGIFKAGVWVGILLVVALLVGVLWIAGKLRR